MWGLVTSSIPELLVIGSAFVVTYALILWALHIEDSPDEAHGDCWPVEIVTQPKGD